MDEGSVVTPGFFLNGQWVPSRGRHDCPRLRDRIELGDRAAACLWAENERPGR